MPPDDRLPSPVRQAGEGALGGLIVGTLFSLNTLLLFWLAPEKMARRLHGLTAWSSCAALIVGGVLAGLLVGSLRRFAINEPTQRVVSGFAVAVFSVPTTVALNTPTGQIIAVAILFGALGAVMFRSVFFGDAPKSRSDGGHKGAI